MVAVMGEFKASWKMLATGLEASSAVMEYHTHALNKLVVRASQGLAEKGAGQEWSKRAPRS